MTQSPTQTTSIKGAHVNTNSQFLLEAATYQSVHGTSFLVVLISRSFLTGDIHKPRQLLSFHIKGTCTSKVYLQSNWNVYALPHTLTDIPAESIVTQLSHDIGSGLTPYILTTQQKRGGKSTESTHSKSSYTVEDISDKR